MFKKLLFLIHMAGLLLLLHHFLMRWFFDIGFHQSLLFGIKLSIIMSGCLIAFMFFKSLKLQRFYFAIYPFGIALFLFGFVFRGMLGGILMSATQYPVISDEVAYQSENITIYTKYIGFFSRCCTYRVSETSYGFLEKEYGEFQTEWQQELAIKSVLNSSKKLKITFEDYVYDDTTQGLHLQNRVLAFDK